MKRYAVSYKRRCARVRWPRPQTFSQQGHELAGKAVGDFVSALVSRGIANHFCRQPYPDYDVCQTLDGTADKQAEELKNSLLKLGAWGLLSLLK